MIMPITREHLLASGIAPTHLIDQALAAGFQPGPVLLLLLQFGAQFLQQLLDLLKPKPVPPTPPAP
jgi:hypothetical protein